MYFTPLHYFNSFINLEITELIKILLLIFFIPILVWPLPFKTKMSFIIIRIMISGLITDILNSYLYIEIEFFDNF